MHAAPAYLGCFKGAAADVSSVLPNTLADQLTANNITEQCWQLAANNKNQEPQETQPLFGVSGRKCYGGKDLAQATMLGPAPESACAANQLDVSDDVLSVRQPQHYEHKMAAQACE
jgi:hypothetical protein